MRLAVVNKSTLVTNDDLHAWTTACAIQVNHACAVWGLHSIHVDPYTRLRDVPHAAWPVVLLDDADQAGALGYHDESPAGRPYGRVFIKTANEFNIEPSTVLSHELLEAAGDVHVNLWADKGDGTQYALELCDPVQDGSYVINGVPVSDFVYPAYFDPRAPAGSRFSELRTIGGPYEIDPNGYAIVRDAGQESQLFGKGRGRDYREATALGSRTSRRCA